MLIENTKDLRNTLGVSESTSFDRVFPHIFNAEKKYIIPLLSYSMYEKLLEFYNNPDAEVLTRADMNPDFNFDFYIKVNSEAVAYARLLYITQAALAHLAFHDGFDVLNTFINDTGFKRQEGEHTKSLFKYQEDNIRNYFRETGYNLLDRMLDFLSINIEYFPEYKDQYALNSSRIVPDVSTMHNIYNINRSYIIYLRTLQAMSTIEEIFITPIVGKSNMDFIYSELKKGTLMDIKVKNILPYIQKPLVWLAVTMIIEESGGHLTDRGLYFEGLKGGISMNDVKMPAEEKTVQNIAYRNKKIAESYLMTLKYFMKQNPDDWVTENVRTGYFDRNNSGKKTFWA